jgi:amidophosphoribosyltransferase
VFDKNEIINEISAGSIYGLNKSGLNKLLDFPNLFQKHCLFEYIYFLNKDSNFEHTNIKKFRNNIGKLMALRDQKFFKYLDEEIIVCGVPNTGNDYAISYADTIELQYKNYIIRNNEVNRTFILSNDEERNKYANKKYIFDPNIKNKNVILIDDSIVRGITLKILIKNLKEFGVNNIYVIISSPPINNTCNFGIDIPTKEELIYNKINHKKIHKYFGCELVRYLDLDLLNEALPDYNDKCTMCLNPNPNPNLDW